MRIEHRYRPSSSKVAYTAAGARSTNGLAHDTVLPVFADRDGHVWFGTLGGGVTRYDGATLTTFTTEEGLAGDNVYAIYQDRHGYMWFGTSDGGVSRYDGERFFTFDEDDGLSGDWVWCIYEDRSGNLWFGTWGRGVIRYDGRSFTTFTMADGLARNNVASILEDEEGNMWFGTQYRGVSRYDGETFRTFTRRDGLGSDTIVSMFQDEAGDIWFACYGGGVSRYDGETFTTLGSEDGVPDLSVRLLFQDRDGYIWVATNGGGVGRYDGKTFQTLTTEDGLSGNTIWSIAQDPQGALWFATNNGATRFTPPPPSPPSVAVDAVVGERRHEGVDAVSLSSTVGLVAFEFSGGNLKTRPEAVVFRYRLAGFDDEWQNTRQRRVEFEDLPTGTYTFEVVAVDRDLVYSETQATVTLTVHWPYERVGWLSALVVAVAMIGWQTARVVRRDRRLQSSNAALSTTNTALSSANKELFRVNREFEGANQALSTANEELEQATQHKSDFLAKMSHDLRTPMNAIIGYTRILLRRSKDILEERQYKNLENIQVSADHLLALINDILDLSKIEAGRMELNVQVVELPQLVNECASAVESLVKPGVALVREVAEIEPVQTDPDRLRRVVMNLLSNAVKFTEAGSITAGLRAVDGQVELSVSDTGVGISAEELPGIFDEFSQVSGSGEAAQGSGLGLAIAKKSVELLGGSIAVESEVGGGTTFTVRLSSGDA